MFCLIFRDNNYLLDQDMAFIIDVIMWLFQNQYHLNPRS